ncbi:hypothetical protein B0G74_7765 [Paraburkholderia sp. BL9I2N2]|jgi:hypothetical protein|nr:hypothetical protein B0G74_7765 [Paraburkholderia sp. BL9I2N2]
MHGLRGGFAACVVPAHSLRVYRVSHGDAPDGTHGARQSEIARSSTIFR